MHPLVFLLIGLILIFIEFYLPGAIMGTAGGLLILISFIQFAIQSDSAWEAAAYFLFIVICVSLLIKVALWRIKNTPASRSIYSNAAQEGFVASTFDKSAIGKHGVVLSDLKPGGYIFIDGQQHQALSQSGYLTKGTEIFVVKGQEESLIVRKI